MAQRTALTPDEEARFRRWYAAWATRLGIDPNPDHPAHQYDYRGAFKAGAEPGFDPDSGELHWPSQWKDEGHPTRFKNGIDTRGGMGVR
jgi:hypothetical protein